MKTVRDATDWAGDRLETRCNAALLGRLGIELAAIYQHTLQAPLPPALQRLTERIGEPTEQLDRSPLGSGDRT